MKVSTLSALCSCIEKQFANANGPY